MNRQQPRTAGMTLRLPKNNMTKFSTLTLALPLQGGGDDPSPFAAGESVGGVLGWGWKHHNEHNLVFFLCYFCV